jgi:hypothetical protein
VGRTHIISPISPPSATARKHGNEKQSRNSDKKYFPEHKENIFSPLTAFQAADN